MIAALGESKHLVTVRERLWSYRNIEKFNADLLHKRGHVYVFKCLELPNAAFM